MTVGWLHHQRQEPGWHRFDTVRPAIEDRGLIKDLIDNNVEIVGNSRSVRASGPSCW